MRGKFITTSLKLAVLAGGKKTKMIDVKETMAAIENFKPIWSKTKPTATIITKAIVREAALEMV